MAMTKDKSQILVVDDDVDIADIVEIYLTGAGFTVFKAHSAAEGLKLIEENEISLAILDVMMPDMDGLTMCKIIRQKHNFPIMMLSAMTSETDKIRGLNMGADDYITKPFSAMELLARVRALSRRQGEVQLEELSFDDLTLGLSTNDLRCGSKSIRLAFKEFEIMRILLSNQKTIVSKETLIRKVWGDDSDAEDNNVEAYISFLRKKISFLGSKVSVVTIRKVGYRLEAGQQ